MTTKPRRTGRRLPPSPLDLASALPTTSEDATVEALLRIASQRGTGRAARPDTLYAAARAHLARRERRQQRDDALTAGLLDQVQDRGAPRTGPALVQQTLALRAPAGGTAAGRFVVANGRTVPATVRFRPSELVTEGGEAWWPPVRLDPARPALGPGEEVTVRLALDLGGCPWPAGTRATLELDVHVADALAMKLWVELTLVAPAGEPA